MTSLHIERNIDSSSSPLICSAAISYALQRAKRYLALCSLPEEEVSEILYSIEEKMFDMDVERLGKDEMVGMSMRLLQEKLPASFNRVREQRCKPNAELSQEYSSFVKTGSLRAKTCPIVQRSSIRSASLERISFNFGKSVS